MLQYLIISIVLAYVVYYYFRDVFNYWKRRGIPQPKNVSILFGNIGESVSMKKNMGLIFADIYNAYKEFKYVGIYNFRIPTLLIRDPDIIKDILVKDFEYFNDNDFIVDSDDKSILNKHPFILKGEEWKIVRNQLSPCFSNAKIKPLFSLMEGVCKNFVLFIEKEQNLSTGQGLDVKELSSKFTTENIATCAFGLEGNCFKDPNSEFREIGRKLMSPSLLTAIKMLLLMFVPSLSSFLKIQLFPDKDAMRLKKIVLETLRYRSENKVVRNDFLDIMINLKAKAKDHSFTDDDIVCHCAAFFVDGFETSSVALAFTLYELGCNMNVQNKLRNEIRHLLEKNNGQLSYEVVQDMSYLDCVLNESLRLHSPGLFLKKACTKRYVLKSPYDKGSDLIIEPKTPVIIPLIGLHLDPQYFSQPDLFDPDRFSSANKDNIVKYTFLPFGDGPRVCLGQKFAVMQVKLALIYVTQNFEIRVNGKTKSPIEVDPLYFMMSAVGGLWLDFHKIKE